MLTISLKITNKKAVAAIFVFLFIIVVFLAYGNDTFSKTQSSFNGKTKFEVEDIEDIRHFLGIFGWETEPEPESKLEVLIPESFDSVMQRYNAIQKAQGTNLADYAGKVVERYTFVVTNYGEYENNVRANVLIYNGKIIGGDICSLALDGFMTGFDADKHASD